MTKASQRRLAKLVAKMNERHCCLFIVASKQNIKYLFGQSFNTGKRFSAAIVTSDGDVHFMLNDIFSNQYEASSNSKVDFYQDGESPIGKIAQYVPFNGQVGVDEGIPIQAYTELAHSRPDIKVHLQDWIERLREIKDEDEIQLLRQSSLITDAVMHEVTQLLQHPTTEQEIAQTIVSYFESHGITHFPFNPIVASGENSFNPHHVPGDRYIKQHESLLIDLGCVHKDYCSDMTRMFRIAGVEQPFLSYYNYLLEAQTSVLEIIKPGVELREIDQFIRDYFKKINLDSLIIHGTGHGIGLEGTEYPYIHSQNKQTVKEGMVVTIGPGIYVKGKFGIRIEDVVCVTKTGYENLNHSSKELLLLDYQSNI